jgi:hypothetical protein
VDTDRWPKITWNYKLQDKGKRKTMEPLERGLQGLSCQFYVEKMRKVVSLVDKCWLLALEIQIYLNGSQSMTDL